MTASHPHFYGAIAEWARVFGAEILVPSADAAWLRAGDDLRVRTWAGALDVLPAVTLVQCGGHFPGSAVLHWADGADGRGVLLSGDTIFVTPGEDRVTFVWSAPNRLPLPEAAVRGVWEAVQPLAFDRITAAGGPRCCVRARGRPRGGRRCGTWSTCGARLSLGAGLQLVGNYLRGQPAGAEDPARCRLEGEAVT